MSIIVETYKTIKLGSNFDRTFKVFSWLTFVQRNIKARSRNHWGRKKPIIVKIMGIFLRFADRASQYIYLSI